MLRLLTAGLLLAAGPGLAEDIVMFQAPSGNIHCMMIDGEYAETRCDIRDFTPSFTDRPADCEGDWGDSLGISPGDRRGRTICHGDTVMMRENPVMGYGNRMQHGGMECEVEKQGVTCFNAEGHGFSISRAQQAVF